MKIIDTEISDVKLIEPRIFEDERGFFYESFNQRKFEDAIGRKVNFVQDNHSKSIKGVLRGLHYQLPPKAQGKLVRVIRGEVFDVAVDVRKASPSFGKWVGDILTAENRRQIWIPEGFAHGFVVLSDEAEFLYKTTANYSPEHERCIAWNDSVLDISWPADIKPLLSVKDMQGSSFDEADVFA